MKKLGLQKKMYWVSKDGFSNDCRNRFGRGYDTESRFVFQSAETPNRKLHYALYLLGSEIGQASVKEQLGLVHELDPQNV